MKPFVINRNSWHYKLNKNFLNSDSRYMEWRWEPRHSDFCAYWRATIIRVIAAIVLSIGLGSFLYLTGLAFYQHPIAALKVIGGVIGVVALIAAMAFTSVYLETRKLKASSKPESLLMQKYRAHKAKICPMVEYDR